jgi:putative transcription factor
MQQFQDWNTVSWDKRCEKNKNESSKEQIARLQRTGTGLVTKTNKTAGNKQKINVVDSSKLRKIENEEDTFKIEKVPLSISKKIAQLRCEKKLSQKDLAMKLSLDVKIIQEYENGKAIPNGNLINKLEKILGKIK